jgi:hypothetical protein
MARRQRQRVVLELTFDGPVSAKEAVWAVKTTLSRLDTLFRTSELRTGVYGTVKNVKQFDRVLAAARAKET